LGLLDGMGREDTLNALWKPILRHLQVLHFVISFSKCTLLDDSILRAGRKLGGTKYKGGLSCICICGGCQALKGLGRIYKCDYGRLDISSIF